MGMLDVASACFCHLYIMLITFIDFINVSRDGQYYQINAREQQILEIFMIAPPAFPNNCY